MRRGPIALFVLPLLLLACGAVGDPTSTTAEDDAVDESTPTADPDDDARAGAEGAERPAREARAIDPMSALAAAPALTLAANTVESGFTGDLVTWRDSAGANRTAFLVRPGADPAGAFGSYLRRYSWVQAGATLSLGPSGGEPGFGFVSSQRASDYAVVSSRYVQGTRSVTSVGPNHLVLEYAWTQLKTSGGAVVPVKATVQWTFVAGRDHPLYAVTYDASSVAANALNLDAKAPAGGLDFTATASAVIDGVGWGDRRKFRTTSKPLTMSSTWDYTATNVVPYVQAWSDAKNTEMGLVQTERYARHDAGYGWFSSNWGKTSATKVVDNGAPASQTMPAAWNWTFALNQWALPNATAKVMGWGMNYGAVGQASAPKYGGGTLSGHPYQSYAVFVALGAKAVTTSQVAQVERATAAAFTATRGTVATSGPAGVGRADTVAYAPAGYDPIYGSYDVKAEASSGAVVVTLDPKGQQLKFPLVRVTGYPLAQDPSAVRLGATSLVAGVDYDVSRDGSTVWFVLKKTITAPTTIGMNETAPPPPPPPATFADVAVDPAQSVGGFTSDVYRWRDSKNRERSAALVRNDAVDPAGFYGGYLRRYTYARTDGSVLTATGGHVANMPGWGFTLHHVPSGEDADTLSSRRAPGSYRTVFLGKHHAIHEYSWNVLRTQGGPGKPQVDRPVKVTLRWMFASGKDHPVWAETIDTTGAGPNGFVADDRAPAGELAFDGVDGPPSGLGWGDRYRFKTTSAALSLASTWDYTQPNRVPYVHMWSDPQNAEMGAVQNWAWQNQDAGDGWFYTNWGRTSANKVVDAGTPATPSMPAEWNWTYQLNQWELSADPNGKRIGWGSRMGTVGKTSYAGYGDDRTLNGYPFSIKSTRVVLGPKGSVLSEDDEVARALDVTFTATEGSVATSGPRGFGAAASQTVTYAPAGWNHLYGVFELVAAPSGGVRVTMATGNKDIASPVFRVRSWTKALPSTITLGAETLQRDVDFFPSLVSNDGAQELWLTLARTVRGPVELAVSAGAQPPGFAFQYADVNHVMGTGQSNSVFNGGVPVLTTTQPYANRMFDVGVIPGKTCDGQGCKGYDVPTSFLPLVEGDTFMYRVETMSSGMANQITRGARALFSGQAAPANDHSVLVSVHGRSGRTYDCLRKGGCGWEGAQYVKPFAEAMLHVQWAKSIAQQQGLSYALRGITAVHGESNHYYNEFPMTGTDGTPNKITSYSDALLEWQADYEASIKEITGQQGVIPMFHAQMHGWTGDSRRTSRIPTDQLDAHLRAPGKVILVAPEYPLPFRTDDGIHFTSEGGRRMGEYFAKAYQKVVLEGGTWEPVRPKSITRAGNVITVAYHVPVPPLALDVTRVTNPGNFGFEYTDGSGAPPAIASVAVTGPDTVQITLASTPTGASKRLRYAFTSVPGSVPGPTTGVRGNLRDSDATPSLYGNALHNWGVTFDAAVP